MDVFQVKVDSIHVHHESRDVCLGGVRGQVDLFGWSALVLWVHHHTVPSEACGASYLIFLTRCHPVHDERRGADLGETEVRGRRNGWRK